MFQHTSVPQNNFVATLTVIWPIQCESMGRKIKIRFSAGVIIFSPPTRTSRFG